MTDIEAVAKKVEKIYRKYGANYDGYYQPHGCNNSCCNPLVRRFDRFQEALVALARSCDLPGVGCSLNPSDYPAVYTLVANWQKQSPCSHKWVCRVCGKARLQDD